MRYEHDTARNKIIIQSVDEKTAIEYLTHDTLSDGDYNTNGLVGTANIESIAADYPESEWIGLSNSDYTNEYDDITLDGILSNRPAVVEIAYAYHARAIFIRADIAEEIINSLDNYPLLDDEKLSQLESDAELEAFNDFGRDDMLSAAFEDDEDFRAESMVEIVNAIYSDDEAFGVYKQACEQKNVYPQYETGDSVYLPTKDIGSTVREILMAGKLGETLKLTRELYDAELDESIDGLDSWIAYLDSLQNRNGVSK